VSEVRLGAKMSISARAMPGHCHVKQWAKNKEAFPASLTANVHCIAH